MGTIAQRMVFGFEDGKITEYPVEIHWDLGFDKDAKLEYIDRVRREAYNRYGIDMVLDVTTANSSVENGRLLSPHILKYPDTSIPVWDYYNEHGANTLMPEMKKVALAYYYLYAICHNKEAYTVFHTYDYYFDVFWKPEGKERNTQAWLCALLRKVIAQRKHKEFFETCTGDAVLSFKRWYLENSQ